MRTAPWITPPDATGTATYSSRWSSVWTQALPHLYDVGLCQPLPVTDANHLSHATGREC